MEKDDIDEFLKKMGMRDGDNIPSQPQQTQWDRVLIPSSSYLIVGDVGTGKTALAFFLLENYSQKYQLTPTVVGFPEEKKELLPENFEIVDSPSDLTQLENAICFIDEADLQLPIEDTKARKYVINFLSLPRHRNQIFLLAFHFPRLVMSRYLPFFSAFLLKRPPYLLEFAGKRQGDALTQMMERAEERFKELPGNDDIVKNTYVVAPRIRWQGMLPNPLCSFWGDELSKVWAGTEIEKPESEQLPLEEEARPERFSITPEYEQGRIVGFKVADPRGIGKRAELVARINEHYPIELENAQITYFQYHALVSLP